MDLRQLEVVREVVETQSITAAARILHCTPSAVSQQLRAAERSAGTSLVEKDGRGVRVTPAARALAERAVDVAVALERARSACDEYVQRAQEGRGRRRTKHLCARAKGRYNTSDCT